MGTYRRYPLESHSRRLEYGAGSGRIAHVLPLSRTTAEMLTYCGRTVHRSSRQEDRICRSTVLFRSWGQRNPVMTEVVHQ